MMYTFFGGFDKYRVLAPNPKGSDFGLTKKHLFTMNTSQKSVFHPRETHILSLLYILVLYKKISGFEKCRVSTQNPKVLAFGFTEKHMFMMKIGQKSVFHRCETHILARLDITVVSTIF
jgi:hypothetical protein